MPTATINQQSITVPDGAIIIQAAEQLNIEIPRYCYHPGLSVAGSCRMCLVEIEKMPKLQPACSTRVTDGMVVTTNSPKVKEAVSGVLEFLLINHPLDCPVCDQAGECYLQDYYMKFGLYDSRMNENKIQRHKAEVIGPHVILDTERCVLCSRCVRFVREVSHSNEIGIFNRGGQSEIRLLPDLVLDNNYSGNVVDICPVGALTDRDFRFQCRVWYLSKANSVCNGCSRGCNITVEANRQRPHHGEGRRVMRLKPRFNKEVNQWWICDVGRYSYKFIDDPSRLIQPLEKKNGELEALDWKSAAQRAVNRFNEANRAAGTKSIIIAASPQLTNEDLFLTRKFFGIDLGIEQIDFRVPDRNPSEGDNFLLRADRNPNTRGAEAILLDEGGFSLAQAIESSGNQQLKLLYICEQDLAKKLGAEMARKFMGQFEYVIYQGSNENETSILADLVLPAATYAEVNGTFTNFQGRVQKITAGVELLGDALPAWQIVCKLAKAAGLAYDYESAGEVFTDLAETVVEFEGLDYEKIGDQGAKIAESAPVRA
ncbi:MAG: 2Fe-2S iron-sulfur cluster-binding protein [Acidobacteria bacterium]|nr:2Fe-2S iron-sulfur cluster-binding protein [Acidobacteriota bacterium]MCI0623029.1 2Fe-2S iron-sulfur cluster-binding protein [Acidobacteriota bacterium]MCI0717463.1 2Fe-2S iron-sulfur cluster-binding protein [Acidobacteriota bacterium]